MKSYSFFSCCNRFSLVRLRGLDPNCTRGMSTATGVVLLWSDCIQCQTWLPWFDVIYSGIYGNPLIFHSITLCLGFEPSSIFSVFHFGPPSPLSSTPTSNSYQLNRCKCANMDFFSLLPTPTRLLPFLLSYLSPFHLSANNESIIIITHYGFFYIFFRSLFYFNSHVHIYYICTN